MSWARRLAKERANLVDSFFEFSLLGMLSSGYLAVLGSGALDTPTAILSAAALVARALLISRVVQWEISPRFVNAAALAYVGFYPLDYSFLSRDFLKATVHLIFFLAIVKILTAKTRRDYLYLKIVAFLELLAASVLSGNANFFLFLALFLLFTVATFSSGEMRTATRGPRVVATAVRFFSWRLAALTVFTSIGILVMTAGMFFLLPRTARAAFQRFAPHRFQLPGFSNEVALGQIGELKMRGTTVFHARIHDVDSVLHLKWRGAALTRFDGKRWFNPPHSQEPLRVEGSWLRIADDRQRRRTGVRITYDVQIKDIGVDALFLAGTPEMIFLRTPAVFRGAGDSLRTPFHVSDQLTYRVFSLLEETSPPIPGDALSAGARAQLLDLPTLDPRIVPLTQGITAHARSDEERARALETYLRTSFAYTTELLTREVDDPLAHFLFTRRKGHCEYFASSMAVMLRAAGIPSRVATGFQSGVYNPISGWYLIRASDAHSWVEAWLPNRGWTTFDPTPPDLSAGGPGLWTRFQLYVDAAETFWQDWILSYDKERQLVLASRVEQSSRSLNFQWVDRWTATATSQGRRVWAWTAAHGGPLLALIAALVLLWRLGPSARNLLRVRLRFLRLRRGQVSASDATVLYQRMLNLLRKRGYQKPAWLTPREFARTFSDSSLAQLVAELTEAYNELRFAARRDAAVRMLALLERLEKAGS
jgi:transglutaminase-like putative cysteine protease